MNDQSPLGFFNNDDLKYIPKEIHYVFEELLLNKQIVYSKRPDVLEIVLDHGTLKAISSDIQARITKIAFDKKMIKDYQHFTDSLNNFVHTDNKDDFIVKNFKLPQKMSWFAGIFVVTLPKLIIQEIKSDFRVEFINHLKLWCDFEKLSRYHSQCKLGFKGGLLTDKRKSTNINTIDNIRVIGGELLKIQQSENEDLVDYFLRFLEMYNDLCKQISIYQRNQDYPTYKSELITMWNRARHILFSFFSGCPKQVRFLNEVLNTTIHNENSYILYDEEIINRIRTNIQNSIIGVFSNNPISRETISEECEYQIQLLNTKIFECQSELNRIKNELLTIVGQNSISETIELPLMNQNDTNNDSYKIISADTHKKLQRCAERNSEKKPIIIGLIAEFQKNVDSIVDDERFLKRVLHFFNIYKVFTAIESRTNLPSGFLLNQNMANLPNDAFHTRVFLVLTKGGEIQEIQRIGIQIFPEIE